MKVPRKGVVFAAQVGRGVDFNFPPLFSAVPPLAQCPSQWSLIFTTPPCLWSALSVLGQEITAAADIYFLLPKSPLFLPPPPVLLLPGEVLEADPGCADMNSV